VLPAIAIFYLMTRVSESPLWLEQHPHASLKELAALLDAHSRRVVSNYWPG
jgi:hypothetical protein